MRIHTIDLDFMGLAGTIASYVVESAAGLIVIETGPSTVREALIGGIRALGADVADVRHVFLTHIHLDHAGGAGWWGEQGAMVYVHERGARHLLDPSRLIASASMIYGEQMDVLWGDIPAVPERNLTILRDGDVVRVGDVEVIAWDTPGHAKHHHTYVVGDVAFTGDVTGVRLSENLFTGLASAPPQFDVAAKLVSLDRIEAGGFEAIYPTHFGRVDDVADHLARYRVIVQSSAAFIRAMMENEMERDEIVAMYRAFLRNRAVRQGLPDDIWQLHVLTNKSDMSADGVMIYWRKLLGIKT